MRVSILGQLELAVDGSSVPLTAPKQRALFALLVLREGETVGVDVILDSLWGQALPTQAEKTLRFHVSKLRSAFRAGGVVDDVIETVPTGYRLPEAAYELDAREFESIASTAADLLEEDPYTAWQMLTDADDLWQGPALVDFTYEEFAQPAIRRLTSQRLVATEDRFEAELRLGKGAELVPDLEAHTHDYPFRERPWGQLMVARYRAGDAAGALQAYQDARTALGDHLGIEPGPELRDLEESVLQNRSEILGRGSYLPKMGGRAVRLVFSGDAGTARATVETWGGRVVPEQPNVAEFEGIASALSAASDLAAADARVAVGTGELLGDGLATRLADLVPGQVALAEAELAAFDAQPARAGLMPALAAPIAGFEILETVARAPAALPKGSSMPTLPGAPLRGRDEPMDRLIEAVRPGRVVTIVGPGGVGKTRLALEASAMLGETSRASLVRLATIEGAAVPAAILASLGAIPREATSMDSVVAAIGNRPVTLILDNCEHLLDAVASAVERLIGEALPVSIICTSRRALEVPNEWVLSLDPLPTAGDDNPAVELFVDRLLGAGGSDPGDEDRRVIADVCRHLDGLPLAIELAATRAASMPIVALRDAVASSTGFLRRRSAEDHRQTTLGATLGWSMDLLDEGLTGLFTDLSVFRGPFRPESAAIVVDRPGTIDVDLSELAAWSLLHPATESGVATYDMLAIVREYTTARLDDERHAMLTQRHLAHFRIRAGQVGKASHGRDDVRSESTAAAEFDNYRHAFTRAVDIGDVTAAVDIVEGLWIFALNRLRFEVHDWADEITRLDGFDLNPLAPRIHGIAAQGGWLRGDLHGAAEHVRAAFDIEEDLGVEPALSPRYALTQLLSYAAQANRLDEISDLAAQGYVRYREMVDWCRASGDPYWLVHSFSLSAMGTAVAGDSERAIGFATRALGAARQSGATSAIAWAEFAMGLAQMGGDRSTATRYLDSSLERSVDSGNRFLYGVVLAIAATMRLQDEGPHVAAPSISDLIGYWHDVGNDPQFWHAIDLAALALHQAGDDAPAAALLSAARRSSGFMPIFGIDRANLDFADIGSPPSLKVPWSGDEAAEMARGALAGLI